MMTSGVPPQLAECVALYQRGGLEYDGDICSLTPLVVQGAAWLDSFGLLGPAHMVVGLLVPIVLYIAATEAQHYQEQVDAWWAADTPPQRQERIPESVWARSYAGVSAVWPALVSLLIVLVDLFVVSPPTTLWLAPLCLWATLATARSNWVASCACCAAAIYQSIFYLPLMAVLSAAQATFGRSHLAAASLVAIFVAALHSISMAAGADPSAYLHAVYINEVQVSDLTPNQGLYWYFFAQVFEHYRLFFVLTLFVMAMATGLLPVFIIRNQPFLLLVSSIAFQLMFSSRATMSEVCVSMAALAIHPHVWAVHRYRLLCFIVLALCGVLGPVLWHAWIYVGSANPNFFYAISFLFNLGWAVLVGELMRAGELRRRIVADKQH